MKGKHKPYINHLFAIKRQAGGITIFTAVLVLILMTLMLFYAARVGVFEQRVSANEARQKQAFHVAEAGLDYAVEYMLALNLRILSKSTQAESDGDDGYYPGWLSTGNVLWADCPADPADDHPCGGQIAAGAEGSLYYDDPDTAGYDALPLDANLLGNLPPNTEVRVTAVICPRTLENSTCLGSDFVPEPDDPSSELTRFSITLLSYGYSDCNDDDGSGAIELEVECRGNAHIAIPFGAFRNFRGSPSVPLVSQNSLPATGSAEVVPNPNGGGVGVPLSIWANTNPACPPLDSDGETEGLPVTQQGSFVTCELQEWYCVDGTNGTVNCDSIPADGRCPGQNASACTCSTSGDYFPETITEKPNGSGVPGPDIMVDPLFPCDLFEFYFGVPSAEYQTVKADATVIDDCSILDDTSTGFFWFSGDTCTLPSVAGSIDNPIILVSAAEDLTDFTGIKEFFGILYISDVEDTGSPASFKPGGGAVVYGAAIVDVVFPPSGYSGNFKVVYNEAGVLNAGGLSSLGGLAGGWRDFGLPQIEWE